MTFIDPSVLTTAINFIVANQTAAGVYNSVGKVIHTDLVSGASGDLALTAFILGAMLEVQDRSLVPDSSVSRAAGYLAATAPRSGDIYATVLRSYVLNLACARRNLQCVGASSALTDMMAAAVKGAPFVFWSKSSGAAAPPPPAVSVARGMIPFPDEAPSNDVELTGYAVRRPSPLLVLAWCCTVSRMRGANLEPPAGGSSLRNEPHC